MGEGMVRAPILALIVILTPQIITGAQQPQATTHPGLTRSHLHYFFSSLQFMFANPGKHMICTNEMYQAGFSQKPRSGHSLASSTR